MDKKFNKITGNLGEDIACKHLIKSGYKILERNFSKKVGEIDIIAQKNKSIYFFEVKTNLANNFKEERRPEERVDRRKLRQIGKTLRIYLKERGKEDQEWFFGVVSILFIQELREARLKIIWDTVGE